jgi:hypothetical protein
MINQGSFIRFSLSNFELAWNGTDGVGMINNYFFLQREMEVHHNSLVFLKRNKKDELCLPWL